MKETTVGMPRVLTMARMDCCVKSECFVVSGVGFLGFYCRLGAWVQGLVLGFRGWGPGFCV